MLSFSLFYDFSADRAERADITGGIVGIAERGCPFDCVFDYSEYLRIVISRNRLVSRAEIEYFSVAAAICHAGAEYLAALKPGDEEQLVGSRNFKRLAVYLFFRQLDIISIP